MTMQAVQEIASWWNSLPWGSVGAVVVTLYIAMLMALGVSRVLPNGFFRRFGCFLTTSEGILFLVMAGVATVAAQKPDGGGTNEPPPNAAGLQSGGVMPLAQSIASARLDRSWARSAGRTGPQKMLRVTLPTGDAVTPEDIARGWRVVCTTNDWSHSYSMPPGASYVGKWHIHGGHRNLGLMRIDFGDWTFPLGSGHCRHSAFWYTLGGRLRVLPFDQAGEISCVGADMFASPGESMMWTAAGDGGSRIVTWENFRLGTAETNELVSAQIELYPNGDFVMRLNEVVMVCVRLDPHDWDGDGLDNLIDGRPTVSDGDCFGTGADWLNANCGGVLSAVSDSDGGYTIAWNTNANENAYYWLSFTATHDRTRVTITCDGPSNLGDMVVIANEGQVCEVPLLIGACYRVIANWPVDDITASDPEAVIEVRQNTVQPSNLQLSNLPPGLRLLGAGGGETHGPSSDFEVERPVNLGIDGDGESGVVTSDPDIGVVIGSITGNCCSVQCTAGGYVWNCNGDCHCHGYHQWWHVTAMWEGYTRLFDWRAQCDCQAGHEGNPAAWFDLSCPDVIMRGGNSHLVSGVYSPPESTDEEASMSLQCTAGAGKITVLSQGDGWMEIQGAAASDSVGDVEFQLVVTIGENTYTNTASLTVAQVERLDMTCDYAGESANPPPFDGETACPFSITNSLAPDRHLVVPFHRVATLGDDGFTVRDFTVDMNLVLEPAGVSPSSLSCDWEVVEAMPQMSGSLSHSGGLLAHFVNPTQGGVYRFRGRCDGSPWTEGNVVLPLCGASIDEVFFADMTACECLFAVLSATPDAMKQSRDFGVKWFVADAAMDYVGRVDSQIRPTVWLYNQVSDSTLKVGLGAVAMWRGVPVRVAKLGNFLAGYGTKRLGIRESSRIRSQSIGTGNDATADMSWQAGSDAFTGGDLMSATGALATNMWPAADMKVKYLWPNTENCDNHVEAGQYFDYNRFFASPGTAEKGKRLIQQQQGEN